MRLEIKSRNESLAYKLLFPAKFDFSTNYLLKRLTLIYFTSIMRSFFRFSVSENSFAIKEFQVTAEYSI